jgi:predicted nicotinamide N-methyase
MLDGAVLLVAATRMRRRRVPTILLIFSIVAIQRIEHVHSLDCSVSSWRKQQLPQLPPLPRSFSRRQLFVVAAAVAGTKCTTSSSASAAASVAASYISHTSGDDVLVGVEQLCQSGERLAPEVPVPGAYQQVCMTLTSCTVPVSVFSFRSKNDSGKLSHENDNSSSGIVELDVAQLVQPSSTAVSALPISGSTGFVIWNSSLLLSRLLQQLATEALYGKTVLELSCGTGLVSPTAAVLGAHHVLATDGNPAVVHLAAQNIARNSRLVVLCDKGSGDCTTIDAVALPWGTMPALDCEGVADIVLGSDLTYNPANWPAVAETMATVLKPGGTVLYLSLGHTGFPVRAELDGFLSVAASNGLVVANDDNDPFGTELTLTNLLLQRCVLPEERSIVQPSGVRVVALRKKVRSSKSSPKQAL